MAVTYSTNLGLALPAQGDWAGTWGTNQNNYITQYLDAAISGAQTISGTQTAVTLSTNNGTSLTQAGGAGTTGSAQYQIINCTGNPASALTVTVPNTSKVYLVINATSTNQTVTVKASATTGVTVAAAKAALIAWNGTDFALIATNDASKISGILAVANGGTGLSSGTSGGIPYFSGSTTMASSAALAANAIVLGGGAGVAPATTTTGTGVVTALGNNANSTGGFATINGTATLTNKRIDPRVSSTTSTASITPDISSFDQYAVTAQAVTLTINAPTGTPVDGNKLIFRILDNGTSQTLTWNATFTVIGVSLPAATTAGKMTYVGCIYNAANTRWDVVAVTTQA